MPELSAKEIKAQKKAQKLAQRAARRDAGAPAAADQANTKQDAKAAAEAKAQKKAESTDLVFFDALEPIRAVAASADVHPAILNLALRMQSCRLIGSSARCKAMLYAFADVIRDYETPQGSTLSRSLATHLSRQIDALRSGRALGVAMGNAIRWLKQQTSNIGLDMADNEAKEYLIELIDTFIRDRLDMADTIIVEHAEALINDGAVIMVYGHSHVVFKTLAHAHTEAKKQFRVIVVDSPPLFEGKRMAAELSAVGISTTYVLITALPYVLNEVTMIMVGAHGLVHNGHLYSRTGTSLVVATAHHNSIPVMVLCETIKFSDKVLLDAFASNETVPNHDGCVFYDLTDQRYISKVITELGALPASSVPVILREYRQLL